MVKYLLFVAVVIFYLSPYISELLLAALFGLIGVSIILASNVSFTLIKSRPISSILLTYLLLAVMSAAWSPDIAYTLFFAMLNLAILLGVMNILDCDKNQLKSRAISYLSLIVLLELLFMGIQLNYRGYDGLDLVHGSGSLQAAIIVVLYMHEKSKSMSRKFLLVVFGLVVILTTSFKIYLAFIIIIFLRLARFLKYTVFLGSILFFSVYTRLLLELDYGKIENLGGRLGPWLLMINDLQENFLLGHGFPFGDKLKIDANFTIENAHNIFLGSGLYLGSLGILLTVILMYRIFKNSNSPLSRDLAILFLTSSMFNVSIAGKISGTLIAGYILLIFLENNRHYEVLQTRVSQ